MILRNHSLHHHQKRMASLVLPADEDDADQYVLRSLVLLGS
jgi:hypothetical protein